MVRKLLYAIGLFMLLPSYAMAAPQLLFILHKAEIQLGHSIDAELYGIDLHAKLVDIDLRGLKEVFGVTLQESSGEIEDPRWPGRPVQMMQFKLYPRQTGNLIVPELSVAGAQTKPQTVLVTPGIKTTRNGVMDIQREIRISTAQPWERQQVIIEVEVIAEDTFASLRSQQLKIPGFDVFSIPASVDKNNANDSGRSVMRIGWVLLPLTAGQYHIEVPPVEYRKSGQTERTYYFPKRTINVKALPPYIPPTMPVGRIHMTSRLQSDTLILPGLLNYWDVTLTGNGISPNWIPAISQQIKSNTDMQFFPATAERVPLVNRDGLQGEVTYHIPFKPISNGRLKLPSLRIQYFDPESARIILATHQPQPALVFSMTLRLIVAGLLLVTLFWAGKYLYGKFCLMRQRHRLRQAAISGITQAQSVLELRMALNLLAKAKGWPINMTLRHFASHCRSKTKASNDLLELLNQLSHACYSHEPILDLENFRMALLAQLRPL
jgi:hypothetical protein